MAQSGDLQCSVWGEAQSENAALHARGAVPNQPVAGPSQHHTGWEQASPGCDWPPFLLALLTLLIVSRPSAGSPEGGARREHPGVALVLSLRGRASASSPGGGARKELQTKLMPGPCTQGCPAGDGILLHCPFHHSAKRPSVRCSLSESWLHRAMLTSKLFHAARTRYRAARFAPSICHRT